MTCFHRPVCFACMIFALAFAVITSAAMRAPGPVAQPGQSQLKLENGTPIKLRLQETISSADAQVDQRVDFDVLEEVKLGDLIVIPKGSIAWGTVTEAVPKKRMARGGKLNVNIDAVRLADGDKAALRGVKDVKGGGHTGAMTGGIVATSIVFFPAAPFFLFMHGKDVTIPKGTEITVYINGDMAIDPSKFASGTGAPPAAGSPTAPPARQPAAAATAPGAQAPPAATGQLQAVPIKSAPDGADITVDGRYVGSTPSTVSLSPGDHMIKIEKSGFKAWERTITVSPGSAITVSATLEHP
jgi:hypothetical protein